MSDNLSKEEVMLGFFKRSSQKISQELKPKRTVVVEFGGHSKEYKVHEVGDRWLVHLYDRWMVLNPSSDGDRGKAMMPDGNYQWYFPLHGWSNADLRKYGFNAPDDGIVPQEIMLARAVLSGDKDAARALADWVVENWGK